MMKDGVGRAMVAAPGATSAAGPSVQVYGQLRYCGAVRRRTPPAASNAAASVGAASAGISDTSEESNVSTTRARRQSPARSSHSKAARTSVVTGAKAMPQQRPNR